MKIAVQMFGHLRTYQQCYRQLYDNLLNLYDCDIFMHTWDTIDHHTQVWHDFLVEETGQAPEQLAKIINKIYKPKLLKIETQHVVDEGNIIAQGCKISLFGIKSMLYGMSEANRLREEYQKEHRVNYDFVLTIRPDILLEYPFKFEAYVNPEDEDCFYTAGFYKFKDRLNDFRYIGASDVLFFAKPEVMSKIFKNTNLLIEQVKNIETSKYGPEYSIIYAIEQMKIKPILLNYLEGEDFKIQRGSASRAGHENIVQFKKEKNKLKRITNKFIRIHLKRKYLRIWILSNLPWQIINFSIYFGSAYSFHFSLGKDDK